MAGAEKGPASADVRIDPTKPVAIVAANFIRGGGWMILARKEKIELNDNNLAVAYYPFSSLSQNEVSIKQQKEFDQA